MVALVGYVILPMNSLQFLVLFVLLMGGFLIADVPLKYVLIRALVIIPLLVMIVLFIPFSADGTWSMAFRTIGRGVCSILTLLLLVSTTPFPAVLRELRRMHVPAVILQVLAFIYRYFFVLIDEIEHMQLAIKARGAGSSNRRLIRGFSRMLGMLIIRSFERSERVFQAMRLRGYTVEEPGE